jgi:hypothetical protein
VRGKTRLQTSANWSGRWHADLLYKHGWWCFMSPIHIRPHHGGVTWLRMVTAWCWWMHHWRIEPCNLRKVFQEQYVFVRDNLFLTWQWVQKLSKHQKTWQKGTLKSLK